LTRNARRSLVPTPISLAIPRHADYAPHGSRIISLAVAMCPLLGLHRIRENIVDQREMLPTLVDRERRNAQ
jgi:hypothetical protein